MALTLLVAWPSAVLWSEPADFDPSRDFLDPNGIHIMDGSFVLDIGDLRVNITNHGLIGSQYSAGFTYSHASSGEWPGGTGNEYLWGAGLWVGATRSGAASVTTGQYDRELRPSDKLMDTIYEARAGIVQRPTLQIKSTGKRRPTYFSDDDGDGLEDEEILNGLDDDGDGQVDEDFGQLGDQMFTCTMFDNLRLVQEIYPEHNPLDLKVVQKAFSWDLGLKQNIVGLDFTVSNIGHERLDDVYLGFYVDCDIQRRNAGTNQPDDLAGCFSGIIRAEDSFFYRVEMGYMWDGAEEDPLPGYFGALLCNHKTAFDGVTAPFYPKINSFQIFATNASVNQDGEPHIDADRYHLMSLDQHDRNTYDHESGDLKFLISSGPFSPLEVNDSLEYQLALVAGRGLDGLLATAVEAARINAGRWFDMDDNWSTGQYGRETLVCLGDYPLSRIGKDPILGHRLNFMDDSCTGGYPIMFQDIVGPETLEVFGDHGLCVYVNMDNCTECLRGTGQECDPQLFFSRRPFYSTGRGGRETNFRWALPYGTKTPPMAPKARVVPGDRQVEIFWDNRSEVEPDPFYRVYDFESYRIWRVMDWVPAGDMLEDSAPPMEKWGMIGEYDIVNQIPPGLGNSTLGTPCGRNTGLEPILYEPTCLTDGRFIGLAEIIQNLVDSDPFNMWYTMPPVRRPNGQIIPGREDLIPWESHPTVLDTFFAVTPREADPQAGIIGKLPTRYYHYIDKEVPNGFATYYAVVARDHILEYDGNQYRPAGAGIEEDPSNHFIRTIPSPVPQTVTARNSMGNNIYVYPNPATRKALEEFQSREPSHIDPTGVRVMFNNLPLAHNTIKIYTVAGDLIQTLSHDGYSEGGATSWNLVSRNGQEVVSGIYLYSIHSDVDGFDPFRGRFVVIW